MMSREKIRAAYHLKARKRCRHCKVRKVSKPKGLCYRCGSDPAIRDLYPSMKVKCNNRGFGIANTNPPPPPERTGAPPGSPRRVKIMAARMKAGLAPLHPDDSPDWTEGTEDDRREFIAQQATGLGKRSTRADLELFGAEDVDGHGSQLDAAEPEHHPG